MKNQCDGCRRGLKVVEGIHYVYYYALKYTSPYMVCTKELYDIDEKSPETKAKEVTKCL